MKGRVFVVAAVATCGLAAGSSASALADESGSATEPAPVEAAVAAGADEAEPVLVAEYDGGFSLRSPVAPFELVIQGRVQARFNYEAIEEERDEGQFSIPRARLKLAGRAHDERLKFALQLDYGNGGAALKDFYVDYAFVPKVFHLQVGQFKRPFSRQQLTSSGKQELVDRAITDKGFGAGRDLGVMLHDDVGNSPALEYAVGVFNGTGDAARFSGDVLVDPVTGEGAVTSGKLSNVPERAHPMVVMRLGYNRGGGKGYSEADLEGGGLRFGVGASALFDFDADGGEDAEIRAELDHYVKAHGFSATGGVYFGMAQAGANAGDQAWDALGWHLQGGYVIAGKVQPVLRYALLLPRGAHNDVEEIRGGVAVYFHGHDLKWQTDAGAVLEEARETVDVTPIVRTQLQLAF